LPAQVKERLEFRQNEIQQIELGWDVEQLDELVKHRCLRIMQKQQVYRYIRGTDNAYKEFLQSLEEPLTPRLLINRLHGEKPPESKKGDEEVKVEKPETNNREKFYLWAIELFTKSELEEVCYLLNLNPEYLKQETLPQFLRSIIEYCERHKKVDKLLEICKGERPTSWPGFDSWI
jgi:hypothetical protein